MWPVAVFAGLLINEISYKGSPEWVEIQNNETVEKSLEGLVLKDANNSVKDDLYLTGVIPAGGYLVFENNRSWLNDSGDSLYLIASSSGEILDQISFETAQEGKTFGRGESGFVFMSPTKGFANITVTPSPTSTPILTSSPTPTSTPNPTNTVTKTVKATTVSKVVATPTPISSPTTTSTVEPQKNDNNITPEVSEIKIENVMTPQVLGEKEIGTTEAKPGDANKQNLQNVGYLLMIGGSVMSLSGLTLGYLKYRQTL